MNKQAKIIEEGFKALQKKSIWGLSGQEEALAIKTTQQEQECIDFLSNCVEDGVLEPEEAQEMIDNHEWDEIQKMMDYADAQSDYLYDLAREKGEI